MNSRTESDEALHHRVWQLLPWLVNDSADEVQRRDAKRHLADCEDCRAELERQSAIHAVMAQPAEPMTNVDAGLARLHGRIDEGYEDAVPEGGPWTQPTPKSGGVRWATYALAAAVVIESGVLSVLGYGALTRANDAPAYRTLSEAAPAVTPAQLRILPEPQMRIGELQRQLQTLQLQIVSGPNAAGAYALAPLPGSHAALDERIARLRTVPGMLLVEPLAPAARGSTR